MEGETIDEGFLSNFSIKCPVRGAIKEDKVLRNGVNEKHVHSGGGRGCMRWETATISILLRGNKFILSRAFVALSVNTE